MRRTKMVLFGVAAVLATWALGAGSASAHFPTCVESVNPHGQTTPPAGSTTLPGPNGGQNEDGFYLIGTDAGSNVFVVTGGVSFGPYPSGTVVKYTQAPGAAPSAKKHRFDERSGGCRDRAHHRPGRAGDPVDRRQHHHLLRTAATEVGAQH